MSEFRILMALGAVILAGCGQRGPLYLPEKNGEIVTRPTQTAPAEQSGEQAGTPATSPQTVDTPAAPANPAPEVTAPAPQSERDKRKDAGGTPQP